MVYLGSSVCSKNLNDIPKVIKSRIQTWVAPWPHVVIWTMLRGAHMGLSAAGWQTLVSISWYISFYSSFPKFPLIFFWIFLYDIFIIFCCNVYEALLYVFSSKTSVRNAPPLPALLDFPCMLDASVSPTRVCVLSLLIPVWLCTPAEHSHALMRHLTSFKKTSSFLERPSTSTPKPSYGICLMWMQSWTKRWTPATPFPLARVQVGSSAQRPSHRGLPCWTGVWKPKVRNHSPSPLKQVLWQEIFPTLLDSPAIWKYCWVIELSLCLCCPGSPF